MFGVSSQLTRLWLTCVECSSQHHRNPVSNLELLVTNSHPYHPSNHGWLSERIGKGQQTIIFRLLDNRDPNKSQGPFSVRRLHIVSHEVCVSQHIQVSVRTRTERNFRIAANMYFSSNQQTGNSAREEKTIELEQDADFVKLHMKECHPVSANAYGQVGIVLVEVFGAKSLGDGLVKQQVLSQFSEDIRRLVKSLVGGEMWNEMSWQQRYDELIAHDEVQHEHEDETLPEIFKDAGMDWERNGFSVTSMATMLPPGIGGQVDGVLHGLGLPMELIKQTTATGHPIAEMATDFKTQNLLAVMEREKDDTVRKENFDEAVVLTTAINTVTSIGKNLHSMRAKKEFAVLTGDYKEAASAQAQVKELEKQRFEIAKGSPAREEALLQEQFKYEDREKNSSTPSTSVTRRTPHKPLNRNRNRPAGGVRNRQLTAESQASNEETRADKDDGKLKTKEQFINEYGSKEGLKKWNRSTDASMTNKKEAAARDEKVDKDKNGLVFVIQAGPLGMTLKEADGNKRCAAVNTVKEGSQAHKLGFQKDDELLSVNDKKIPCDENAFDTAMGYLKSEPRPTKVKIFRQNVDEKSLASNEETRADKDDGKLKTKEQFINEYGSKEGLKKWNRSTDASMTNKKEAAARDEKVDKDKNGLVFVIQAGPLGMTLKEADGNKRCAAVNTVKEGSQAHKLGFQKDDELLSVNDKKIPCDENAFDTAMGYLKSEPRPTKVKIFRQNAGEKTADKPTDPVVDAEKKKEEENEAENEAETEVAPVAVVDDKQEEEKENKEDKEDKEDKEKVAEKPEEDGRKVPDKELKKEVENEAKKEEAPVAVADGKQGEEKPETMLDVQAKAAGFLLNKDTVKKGEATKPEGVKKKETAKEKKEKKRHAREVKKLLVFQNKKKKEEKKRLDKEKKKHAKEEKKHAKEEKRRLDKEKKKHAKEEKKHTKE